ncbi:MAG: hypothetical protein AAB538_00555 [Patescibacteria group bacterium]
MSRPLKTVPEFIGGPFRTWIEKHYDGNPRPTMHELSQREAVKGGRSDLTTLIRDFPPDTTLIGLTQGEKVVVVEGMHRALAVALAADQGKTLSAKINIALADASGEELPVVGQTVRQK